MRIVSINAWGGQLHGELIAYLAAADADVVCLQEVVRSPDRHGSEWLTYRDANVELRQRSNLFAEIAAALPAHDASFFPTSRGELLAGDEPALAEFGIATFKRRTLPTIGEALGFVHGAFSPDSFGAHPRPRNAHCLRLFDHAAGTPITIAHLHGLRTTNGKADTPERRHQAEALVRLIRQVWPGHERLVVCGDLNILPGSEIFSILAELGLRDLVIGGGFMDTRTSHYRKAERYADYMLATPDVRVARFNVVRVPEVSDHCPLLLDIASGT